MGLLRNRFSKLSATSLAAVVGVGTMLASGFRSPTAPALERPAIEIRFESCEESAYTLAAVGNCEDYTRFWPDSVTLANAATTRKDYLVGTLITKTTRNVLNMINREYLFFDCGRPITHPQAVYDGPTQTYYQSFNGKYVDNKFQYANYERGLTPRGIIIALMVQDCLDDPMKENTLEPYERQDLHSI